MKLIVVSGFHGNETPGIWICKDWDSKKSGGTYTELGELAGRKITSKELVFSDVSRYTAHELQKEFAKEYQLKQLLKLYVHHINEKKMPEDWLKLLQQYIVLWKNVNVKDKSKLEQLKERCAELSQQYTGPKIQNTDAAQIGAQLKPIFPEQLHKFVYYPNMYQAPEVYEKIESIKKELGRGAFIVDLHSKNVRGPPFITGNICIPTSMQKDFWEIQETLTDRLKKHAKFEDVKWKISGSDTGCMLIEIPCGFKPADGTDTHTHFSSLPSAVFLDHLYHLFNHAVYGIILKHSVFYYLIADTSNPRYADPSFYKSNAFKEAKGKIANMLRELLEFRDNYANKTN